MSQSEEEDEEEVESEVGDAQAAEGRRGWRPTARAGGTARSAMELRMVPRATWPDDPCDELRGEGWMVEVVKTVGKADAAKVLCRFVMACTEEGQPYADERMAERRGAGGGSRVGAGRGAAAWHGSSRGECAGERGGACWG